LSQRSSLLDTQERAAADVAELEERLAKIHAPLQERLRAYEQRIRDLERELALKGEENRELIKAKIQLTKEHLEAAKDWVEMN
jgi:DNA-binding transcriptional MerR regulator